MKHEFARLLRRDQTGVERKLWLALRDRRFHKLEFRRRQPIGPYIVDFVSFEAKLVIELDGDQHGLPANKTADCERTKFLESDGFKVIRFWNYEVIENFEVVLDAVALVLGLPV